MKKTTKILSLVFAGLISGSVLVSCNNGRELVNPDDDIDTSKTQLVISNYEGGYGRVWLDNAAKRFEEKYADICFEPGTDKKGVQIKISSAKDGKAGENFLTGLKNDTAEVIFTEDTFYYDLIAKGYAADITDAVTQPLTEFNESASIEGKLDEAIQDYFKTSDNKYYALPHYEAYCGIIYDVDLFDQVGFWRSTSGEFLKPAEFTGSIKKSNGPDGQPNTYDDGLPATFDEFFALCDYMAGKGVTPFTAPGGIPEQATLAMYQLWADYEGKENFQKNYSLTGTATVIDGSKMPANGKPNAQGKYETKTVTITEDNGWELQGQAGKYIALDFMKRIADNRDKYCTDEFYSAAENNITAQGTYLLSRLKGEEPIAFLLDGVWWENEADESGYFKRYESFGETRQTRKFGFMPFPKASTAQVGEKRTLATTCNQSLTFINSNVTDKNKLALAKKFLQFIHTDVEMQEFSVATSALKPMKYQVSSEKTANMTYFGKDILAMRSNQNIDVVYTFSGHTVYLNHFSYFHPGNAWKNNSYSDDPFVVFKNNSSITVKNYYDAIIAYSQNQWQKF